MNIGIIGLGLMGGSLGRALVKYTTHTVFGRDSAPGVIEKAAVFSAVHADLTDGNYGNIDLLFVCLNPRATVNAIKEALPKLKEGALVCDISGEKRLIFAEFTELSKRYPNINFVATHPMAGREFQGIEKALPTLFKGASVILTPVTQNITAIETVIGVYRAIGAEHFVHSSAEEHDKNIAFTSQLPHLLSSCYIKSPTAENEFGFSAGSFKDLSRVARMNASMWTELMLDNRDNVSFELGQYIKHISEYKAAIDNNDAETLSALITQGTERKLKIEQLRKQ
ncbi:MAG: prephenate dehydrogenase [Christensenellaceae bacterium]|jgi:prephenate dehydrogenase|nr:prephenate dehydrogenase [Christensenellaceae bacterium]